MISLIAASEAFAGTEIDLSGTWKYCLINSEKDYPPAENTLWESVQLPNRRLFEIIAEKNNISSGYILYRKTVKINNTSSENLVFQAGEIMNTDIVYINGKKIGNTGKFPPDFKSGWSKFRNYPLHSEFLIHGENSIDIINYFNAELWFISPIRIIDEESGNFEFMYKNFIQIEFIHALWILLMSFSLLFITIYLKRKKEIVYLYYASATFLLSDMTILQFVENLYPYLPLSSNTIFKICAIGLIFFPPFLAFFFRSYLDVGVKWKRIVIYLFLPVTFALLMSLSQDRYYIILWRNIFLLLIPIYIVDIVIVSIRQLISGNKKGRMLFLTLLPVFIFGIYDILVFSLHLFEGGVPLYPIGVPFMLILIGLQLVNRFIYNLNTSEQLNIILLEKMEEGKRLARLENEISIARKIQLANVPEILPESSAFGIGVKYIPADDISGDFYNFHFPEQDKIGVLIADVSGHGIPASLIASMVKILFSTLAPVYANPDLFIKGLNRYLFDKMEGNFLTAGYCYISALEKKAKFARAGHELLLHISCKNSEAEMHQYKPRGMIIGFKPDIDLEIFEFNIDSGDRIILYTDGLVEVHNERREIFGQERLNAFFMKNRNLSINETIELIYNALSEWNSFKAFDDDFTLIIIDIV